MILAIHHTRFRRRLTRAIALPVVLLLLLSGISIWQITRLLSALEWVDHTGRVISQANSAQKLLLDMETGFRGYLLTGEPEFLEPYEQASTLIEPSLEELKTLVADNPSQVQRIVELMTELQRWERQASPAIARRQRGELEPLSNLRRRKQLVDQMRQQITAFVATEEELRNQRSQRAQAATQTVIVTSVLLAVGIGGALAYFIYRQILQVSRTYEGALQTAQARTREAEQAAVSLRRSAQRLAALHDIDRAILATEMDKSLIDNALTQMGQVVPYQEALVAVFDLEAETAQVLAGIRQTGKLTMPVGTRLAMADFAPEQGLLHGIRYVQNLPTADSCPPVLVHLRSHGFLSCLCVPLLVENTLVGELNLASVEPAAFNTEAQEIAVEVANQLAIALQQSRLRGQLQATNQQLQHELQERLQAEMELREQEQLFRSTFNQAAVGIAHVSSDGRWLRVNQKLSQIVGYTRDELLQRTFQDITYPEDLDIDLTYFHQILADEIQTYSMEKRYVRKDHSLIWINLTVSLVRKATGEPSYFISVVEDISDRKQAEDALQQLNDTLEQRVRERTAQLAETNQELEAFTYSVSHDLRAPLRTMQGFAQALLEDCGDQLEDVCQSYIDSIIDDAVQMNGLISDLLDYSRLTRTQINLQSIGLNEVVADALKQLAAQIEEKQAQINVATALPTVMAHRSTLVQVVTNLVGNAIKFVEPTTQPQIDIFAEETYQDDGRWIRLWIVDNGIGIAPEHQERVFRVFERLHGAESYPGTGIGLAIVRKGLERMGGQAGVESQLGQGSRFWIALPSAVLALSERTHDLTPPNSFD
ncbi:CHASE3 domain-containing protein [Nodosilinea sp. LEGE 06152]|uniref:CHASE3 domain-containing protein n=1 Tax=Nodosilinea sp. LEGE 06152 TaxID=2777966 RepID=UPI001880299B|nr:CHASE3 domain-containing protein [Nodosilinea sp. LEGE 06152]MBE9157280.1 CHASE3 domain-containing protein [Nodosilinea sp. LEGE 06152]